MHPAHVNEDLDYVRGVVTRAGGETFPRAILYLWAAIGAVGFALIDFAPEIVAPFWTIAGPVGFVISAWLGARHARTSGQISERDGRNDMLHWGGMTIAIFMVVALAATGAMPQATLPRVILLIVAFGYYLSGVYVYRPLIWLGLLMAATYGALFFVDRYAWTMVGAVLAIGLIATARLTRVGAGE